MCRYLLPFFQLDNIINADDLAIIHHRFLEKVGGIEMGTVFNAQTQFLFKFTLHTLNRSFAVIQSPAREFHKMMFAVLFLTQQDFLLFVKDDAVYAYVK
ncbi:hypothetical protein D3C72_890570 [compost metagenome]